jgi:deazaflavin-dependent oxidoreductase (nitroreductase family)
VPAPQPPGLHRRRRADGNASAPLAVERDARLQARLLRELDRCAPHVRRVSECRFLRQDEAERVADLTDLGLSVAVPDSSPPPPRARAPVGLSLGDRLALCLESRLDRALGGLFVRLYRLTRGGIARLYRVHALVLTTRGRRTGRERTVMLAYFPQGERFVVVAANGGKPRHPAWYLNLRATPTARVEIGDRTLAVRAEERSRAEAAAFWPVIVRTLPGYARYPRATSRIIPLVRLVPLGAEGETP